MGIQDPMLVISGLQISGETVCDHDGKLNKVYKILKIKNASLPEALKGMMWYKEVLGKKESITWPYVTLGQHFRLDINLE